MLSETLVAVRVTSSTAFGIDPELIEPAAFAWMARETLAGWPSSIPTVTGARHAAILGAIYQV